MYVIPNIQARLRGEQSSFMVLYKKSTNIWGPDVDVGVEKLVLYKFLENLYENGNLKALSIYDISRKTRFFLPKTNLKECGCKTCYL